MAELVTDPLRLERDVLKFAISPQCPEELRAKLMNLPGSLSDRIEAMARALYAHYDLLNVPGKRAMAHIFEYGVAMAWGSFIDVTSAPEIAEFTARDLGERPGKKPPAKEEWPRPTFEGDRRDWRVAKEQGQPQRRPTID